ncbi:MAG: major facilitator superfamily domain-containing protein [Monoraphidium minutum]|nr:MAG: major facilitator superfamily domain-containing protein [Monoraphidium minutum]
MAGHSATAAAAQQQHERHHRQQHEKNHRQQPQQRPGARAAPPPPRVPPPVWLVVWIGFAAEWLRGYTGGMFYGAKIILSPRHRRDGLTAAEARSLDSTVDTTSLNCMRFASGAAPQGLAAAAAASELLFPALGAALAGWLTRRVGRRASVVVGCGLMCVGQLVSGVTARFIVYVVGADIYTAGSMLLLQSMMIEVIEVVPTARRGSLVSLRAVAAALGFSMAAVVVLGIKLADLGLSQWRWGFRLSLILGIWPAAMLMCVIPWMLDTPSSLLQRGRLQEARQALQSLRGEFSDVREEYEAAARAVSKGKGKRQLDLLRRRPQRPALVLTLCLGVLGGAMDPGWLIEPDTNIYGATAAVVSLPFLYTTLLPGIAGVMGAIVCCLVVDRAGRRRLMVWSSAACSLAAAALCGLMARHHAWQGAGRPTGVAFAGVILSVVYVLHFCSYTCWLSVDTMVVAEVTSINTRSAVVALQLALKTLTYRGVHIVMLRYDCTAQLYAAAVYAVTAAAAAVFAWLLVPETAGVPLDAVPRERVYTHSVWRRFAPPAPVLLPSGSLARALAMQRGASGCAAHLLGHAGTHASDAHAAAAAAAAAAGGAAAASGATGRGSSPPFDGDDGPSRSASSSGWPAWLPRG